jgi:ribose-phosphate pyrophosphokinase
MIAAAVKASAKEVTVVMPYLSYACSDKKWRGRMPIAGKLFGAELLEEAGMDRMVGIEFHSPEFEGFYGGRTKVDHLRTLPIIAHYLQQKNISQKKALILPGDEGFHKRAEELGRRLGLSVGSVEKTRIGADKVVIQAIKGEVKGREIIIFDDEICTATTVGELAKRLQEDGAKSVLIAATHGLFQGKAIENLNLPLIEEIIITDTVPLSNPDQAGYLPEKLPLKVISVAPLLAAAIKEIQEEGSVSRLFEVDPSEYGY